MDSLLNSRTREAQPQRTWEAQTYQTREAHETTQEALTARSSQGEGAEGGTAGAPAVSHPAERACRHAGTAHAQHHEDQERVDARKTESKPAWAHLRERVNAHSGDEAVAEWVKRVDLADVIELARARVAASRSTA